MVEFFKKNPKYSEKSMDRFKRIPMYDDEGMGEYDCLLKSFMENEIANFKKSEKREIKLKRILNILK